MRKIIGIDIGGTKCSVVAAEVGNGININDKISFMTKAEMGYEHTKNRIFSAVSEILERNNLTAEDIEGIGVSCGGPLDSKRGIVMSPPNLPGWDNIPFTKLLYERFGIPAYIQNDANACALVEWKLGAGRGFDSIVFLTMGTGMGAGIIAHGTLIEGIDCMGGEVGHIRLAEKGPIGFGKSGSFEGFCSGGGIGRLANIMSEKWIAEGNTPAWIRDGYSKSDITAKLIAEYAKNGDPQGIEIFESVGEKLGEAISILVDVLNPDRVIIGSVFARSENLLRASMEKAIQKEALAHSLKNFRVVPVQTGEALGDFASVMTVCHALGLHIGMDDDKYDASESVLSISETLFSKYPGLLEIKPDFLKAYCILRDAFKRGNKLLLCGNGGSASDCGHITGELMKGFYKRRPLSEDKRVRLTRQYKTLFGESAVTLADSLQESLMAIDLTQHNALSTAFANDVLPDLVFSQQIQGYGSTGDVLLAISTSGNAKNCCLAALTAKACGMSVISLTGSGGGKLSEIADCAVKAPGAATADIQENHLPIYHALCKMLEETFFAQ